MSVFVIHLSIQFFGMYLMSFAKHNNMQGDRRKNETTAVSLRGGLLEENKAMLN